MRMDESEELVTVRLLPSFISKTAEHESNKLGAAPSTLHRIITIWYHIRCYFKSFLDLHNEFQSQSLRATFEVSMLFSLHYKFIHY